MARQAQGFTIPLEFIGLINSSHTRHAMEPNHSELPFPSKMTDDEKIARDWINAVERNRVREADIYPQLKAWVHQISATDILDVGCRQGICSDKIDLRLRNYTGIDLSPILIDRAKQLYNSENRHFLTGSIYDLPFSAGDIAHSLEDAGMRILEVEEFRKSSDGQKQYVSIRGMK